MHNTLHVLKTIWSRSDGKFIFLPRMTPHGWVEGGASQPEMLYAFHGIEGDDHYFSPLRYNGTRRKSFLGDPGVIFADLDGVQPPDHMPPSVLLISSQGHGHGYWFLDRPYTPEEWEPRAKGWTLELGADPGGWDATQVLRVPDTLNHKYDPPFRTYVQQFVPNRIYRLDDFPEARNIAPVDLMDQPKPDSLVRTDVLNHFDLPLTARFWLSATQEDLLPLGNIDRSRIMWETERKMFEAGFSIREVFHAMHFSNINKWRDRPDKLWAEVNKSALVKPRVTLE